MTTSHHLSLAILFLRMMSRMRVQLAVTPREARERTMAASDPALGWVAGEGEGEGEGEREGEGGTSGWQETRELLGDREPFEEPCWRERRMYRSHYRTFIITHFGS